LSKTFGPRFWQFLAGKKTKKELQSTSPLRDNIQLQGKKGSASQVLGSNMAAWLCELHKAH
jgi:hypothetical protein